MCKRFDMSSFDDYNVTYFGHFMVCCQHYKNMLRFQNEKTSPVLWPQMTNGAIPAVEIRSPGVRLPDSALVIDLPALAAVNTP